MFALFAKELTSPALLPQLSSSSQMHAAYVTRFGEMRERNSSSTVVARSEDHPADFSEALEGYTPHSFSILKRMRCRISAIVSMAVVSSSLKYGLSSNDSSWKFVMMCLLSYGQCNDQISKTSFETKKAF